MTSESPDSGEKLHELKGASHMDDVLNKIIEDAKKLPDLVGDHPAA